MREGRGRWEEGIDLSLCNLKGMRIDDGRDPYGKDRRHRYREHGRHADT